MSFSKDTKAELAGAQTEQQWQLHALVYGLVLFSKRFSPEEITLTTESHSAATVYSNSLSQLAAAIVDVRCTLSRRGSDGALYTLRVPDKNDCERIYDSFGHSKNEVSLRINRANIGDDDAAAFFLRGVFLSCGSVSSPDKDYHLEFSVAHRNLASDLARLIDEIEVLNAHPGIAVRKGSYVVYIKGSDSIADVLAFIGAPMASLEIVQQRIYRSLRNKVNRKINSETANSNKTAAAAAKQIRAIERIEKKRGLSSLPDELRELARLRLDNPEYNLRELGEALSTPISRSGVNHRLQRLIEISEEL